MGRIVVLSRRAVVSVKKSELQNHMFVFGRALRGGLPERVSSLCPWVAACNEVDLALLLCCSTCSVAGRQGVGQQRLGCGHEVLRGYLGLVQHLERQGCGHAGADSVRYDGPRVYIFYVVFLSALRFFRGGGFVFLCDLGLESRSPEHAGRH